MRSRSRKKRTGETRGGWGADDLQRRPTAEEAQEEPLTLSPGGNAPLSTVQQTIFACQRILRDDPCRHGAWRLLGLALATSAQHKGVQADPTELACTSDAAAAVHILADSLR